MTRQLRQATRRRRHRLPIFSLTTGYEGIRTLPLPLLTTSPTLAAACFRSPPALGEPHHSARPTPAIFSAGILRFNHWRAHLFATYFFSWSRDSVSEGTSRRSATKNLWSPSPTIAR